MKYLLAYSQIKMRSTMYATLSISQLFVYCLGGQIVTDQVTIIILSLEYNHISVIIIVRVF